ncbi:hypothetical protein C9374_011249 [Naegleria lovaniensis]|uniref:EamA domain-containing protein n=1 Tax=Naegleria lovaniensis TaxID=51637 RepID=A0AA88H2L8_NAELO|nr:uncharacterized protein C9374_011249 [Naegleria lovaniensis]KAG2392524.1 hypothetical protein C9374_011249 [Naegleria lovaniensis]
MPFERSQENEHEEERKQLLQSPALKSTTTMKQVEHIIPNSLYYQTATINHSVNDHGEDEKQDENSLIHEDSSSSDDDGESDQPFSLWRFLKKAFVWFTSSQLLAHLLLLTTLFTFGGYVVLIPHAILLMHPTIFALFRSLLIVIGLFPAAVFTKFSFRKTKTLNRQVTFVENILFCGSTNSRYQSINDDTLELAKESKYSTRNIVKRVVRFILSKIPTWKQFKKIFWLGFFINMNQILFFLGLRWTNATIAGIMQPMVAIITCILSILLKREGRSVLKIIGVIVAVLGAVAMLVVSTVLSDKKAPPPPDDDNSATSGFASFIATFSFTIGMLFLCVNMFFYALYLINFKKVLQEEKFPVLTLAFWTWLIGSVVPLLPALYFSLADFGYSPLQVALRMDKMAYVGLFYGGLVHGALFFVLNSKASSLTTPTVIGVYSTLNPIVTSVMAFLFLHERVSPFVIPGAAFILFGVTMVIIAKWREGRAQQKQAAPRSCYDWVASYCGVSRGSTTSRRKNEVLMALQA